MNIKERPLIEGIYQKSVRGEYRDPTTVLELCQYTLKIEQENKDMYEALKILLGNFEELYAEAIATIPDRTRIVDIANRTLSQGSKANKALNKAEGRES